jgi:CheY-like chemotaxis protein
MHVLVVDDSADIRFMLRVLLEGAGMEVEEAPSGREALARLLGPEGPVDAVVLDQRMPDMTGVEVARALREHGVATPLVLFSAYLHPTLHAEAQALGVTTVGKTDLFALVDLLHEPEQVAA